jgi:hypothetical protein
MFKAGQFVKVIHNSLDGSLIARKFLGSASDQPVMDAIYKVATDENDSCIRIVGLPGSYSIHRFTALSNVERLVYEYSGRKPDETL